MTPTEAKYVDKMKEFNQFLLKAFLLHNKKDSIIILFESEISALEQEMEKELQWQIDHYSFSSDPHDD